MTFHQAAILAILLVMLCAYATERFRVEMVALVGLTAGCVAGVVPIRSVFSGFSTPAVVTVIEVLLIVTALSRTRVIDDYARRITAFARTETGVLLLLCASGAFVSVFMNNIGALALMFPVATQVCSRLEIPASKVLMPLSFATLLGGMCSLTGTPANLIVNQWVVNETGRGLSYFELGMVGAPLTIAGVIWVSLAGPRLFGRVEEGDQPVSGVGPTEFLAERAISKGSRLAGLSVPAIEESLGLRIDGVIRNGAHVFARRHDIVAAPDDVIIVEGDIRRIDGLDESDVYEPVVATNPADLSVEAVVMPESLLLGSRIEDVEHYGMGKVKVSALASRRGRVEGRFADMPISMGDVLVLCGQKETVRLIAAECGLLLLSPRRTQQKADRSAWPVPIFAFGIAATAFNLVPTQIAFGGVVLGLIATGTLNLRSALQDLNWSIILLLAAMIPLGLAVEETGAARLIANTIADYLPAGKPLVVVLAILVLAVLTTPFIDNVSTAVVLSPIAASLAVRTGTPVEPLLMAVAIGASVDFLTPVGHHNNAVVMGAGGYRFLDFSRLGAPLSVICLILAAFLFWAMMRL